MKNGDDEFVVGVEETRSNEELLKIVKAKLDLFEVLQSTTYVLTKFAEEGSGKYDTEAGEFDAMVDEGEKSSMDITINLDNDYFRVLKIENSLTEFKYSVICQIDFDNVTFDHETTDGVDQEYEDLIDTIRAFDTGEFKKKGESKYLLDGGKNQDAPEYDRTMLANEKDLI